MKNRIKVISIVIILSIGVIAFPSESHAIDLDVGAIVSYQGWVPAFRNLASGKAKRLPSFGNDFDQKGTFMLGLNLWYGIGDGWGMRWNFLAGVTKNDFDYKSFGFDSNIWGLFNFDSYYEIGNSDGRRFDTALTFDKKINESFKFVIGIRFNYASGEGSFFQFDLPGMDLGIDKYSIWYLGPTAGVELHHHIGKNFYIDAGLSILLQFAQYTTEKKTTDAFFSLIIPYEYQVGCVAIGLDSNIGVSYFIDPANLLLTALFRYQMLPHISVDDDVTVPDFAYKTGWMSGEIDHLFGLLFYVTYKFGK